MYNGIGLQTARGSGTNGYVQRNIALLRNVRDKVDYKSEEEVKKLEAQLTKGPNKDILAHERKRKVELKCMEMQELMEEQGYTGEEIETKVTTFRKMLMAKEGVSERSFDTDETGRPIVKESHQVAEASQLKNDAMKAALGISEYFKEGSSFDSERKAKEEQAKTLAMAQKQYNVIRESSSSRSPSPVRKSKKKKKKTSSKRSRSDSESPERKKKKKKKKHRHDYSDEDEGTQGMKRKTRKRSKKSVNDENESPSDSESDTESSSEEDESANENGESVVAGSNHSGSSESENDTAEQTDEDTDEDEEKENCESQPQAEIYTKQTNGSPRFTQSNGHASSHAPNPADDTSKLERQEHKSSRAKRRPRSKRRRHRGQRRGRGGRRKRSSRRRPRRSRSRSITRSHHSHSHHSRSKSRSESRSKEKSRERSRERRSPSIRRRRGSPSHLERRRITSARKRPVPYYRPSLSPSTDSDQWTRYHTPPRRRHSYSPSPHYP